MSRPSQVVMAPAKTKRWAGAVCFRHPSGMRLPSAGRYPVLEAPAYFQMSLRDRSAGALCLSATTQGRFVRPSREIPLLAKSARSGAPCSFSLFPFSLVSLLLVHPLWVLDEISQSRIGMLRLRGEVHFVLLTAPLSMTNFLWGYAAVNIFRGRNRLWARGCGLRGLVSIRGGWCCR
jgi:hypothetical protein